MFVENSVKEAIESFDPEHSDITELRKYLDQFGNHVFRLEIRRLRKRPKSSSKEDLMSEDLEGVSEENFTEPEFESVLLDFKVVLGCLPNLTVLSIILSPGSLDADNFQLPALDFDSLLSGLRLLPKLQKFGCSNGFLSKTISLQFQVDALCQHFTSHQCLRELDLSHNLIEDERCDAIRQLLQSTPSLESLVLRGNRIGDDGAVAIASALHVNRTVRKLDLSKNRIGNRGGESLAEVMSADGCLVEHLNVSCNKLGVVAGVALANAVRKSKSLLYLDVSATAIGKESGREFSNAMEANWKIKSLYLYFCQISRDDEDHIYQCLLRNRRKSEFDLHEKK